MAEEFNELEYIKELLAEKGFIEELIYCEYCDKSYCEVCLFEHVDE